MGTALASGAGGLGSTEPWTGTLCCVLELSTQVYKWKDKETGQALI